MDSDAFLLARNGFSRTFANAKMEAGNDVVQTMIDAAYAHRDFDRFRRRFLLMRRNRGDRKRGALPDAPSVTTLGLQFSAVVFLPTTFNHHRSYRALFLLSLVVL